MSFTHTIELLGGLRYLHGSEVVAQFRIQKTAILLAYLACYIHRTHAREELIELLWPDSDMDSGRTSLRTALATLRRQLEPAGVSEGSILVADRAFVQLNAAAVTTDVADFEARLKAVKSLSDPAVRADALRKAVGGYGGPFLPGFYEDWTLRERERLQGLHLEALRELVGLLAEAGDFVSALEYGHRVVSIDPLIEDAHADLMRFYAATGQIAAVTRQYRELERVLQAELGASPSSQTQALLEKLKTERVSLPPREVRLVNAETAAEPVVETASQPHAVDPPLEKPSETATPPRVLPASSSLPRPMTRFIGREAEVSQLKAMLEPYQTRLLTLIGPGGAGKTRLSLEAARQLVDAYGGRVWFVPLAEVTDAARLPDALMEAFHLPRTSDETPLYQIAEWLGTEPALLALDNFEQIAESGAEFVQELLEAVPALTIIVTSRQRLELGIERQFPIPPLSVPDVAGSPDYLAEFSSVRLFMDRAQSVQPEFSLTRENAAAIAALCERLEGLPLALELAAAWAQTLTPAQMLSRLERRFDLLTSRRKDLAPRHRTLRNAVEWSYQLLEPDLQSFFTQLSVFRGGWTLEAAEAVCDELYTLELTQQLRDRSMIVAHATGEGMRFRFLETLRLYAEERLEPEAREVTMERHLHYFVELATQARRELDGPGQTRWLEILDQEQANFRAALEWAGTHPALARQGLHLAARLHFFWGVRGYFEEGFRWLDRFLQLMRNQPAAETFEEKHLHALALQGAAELAYNLGNRVTARTYFAESLILCREIGYSNGAAYSLNYLGIVELALGNRGRAQELFEESLLIWRELGNPGGIAHVLKCLGEVLLAMGEANRAQVHYEEGMAIYRSQENPRGILMMLGEMARLKLSQSHYAEAEAHFTEYLHLSRDLKDPVHASRALFGLGQAACGQGDYPRAQTYLEESLQIEKTLGQRHGIVSGCEELGRVALEQGDYPTALALFEEGLSIAREIDDRQNAASLLVSKAIVHHHWGEYDTAKALLEESLAVFRELDNRMGIARCLRHLGNAATDAGHWDDARIAYEEGLQIVRELEDLHGISMGIYDLGTIVRHQGDLHRARELWQECRSLDYSLGIKGGSVLGALASLALEQGEYTEARSLWLQSLKEHREIGDQKGAIEAIEGLARLTLTQGTDAHLEVSEDRRSGYLKQAARLYSASHSLRKRLGTPIPVQYRELRERQIDTLKTMLGTDDFSSVWADGANRGIDDTFEEEAARC